MTELEEIEMTDDERNELMRIKKKFLGGFELTQEEEEFKTTLIDRLIEVKEEQFLEYDDVLCNDGKQFLHKFALFGPTVTSSKISKKVFNEKFNKKTAIDISIEESAIMETIQEKNRSNIKLSNVEKHFLDDIHNRLDDVESNKLIENNTMEEREIKLEIIKEKIGNKVNLTKKDRQFLDDFRNELGYNPISEEKSNIEKYFLENNKLNNLENKELTKDEVIDLNLIEKKTNNRMGKEQIIFTKEEVKFLNDIKDRKKNLEHGKEIGLTTTEKEILKKINLKYDKLFYKNGFEYPRVVEEEIDIEEELNIEKGITINVPPKWEKIFDNFDSKDLVEFHGLEDVVKSDEDDNDSKKLPNSSSKYISNIEMVLINNYLYLQYLKKEKAKEIVVKQYGVIDNSRIMVNHPFIENNSHWFECIFEGNDMFVQTRRYQNSNNLWAYELIMSSKKSFSYNDFDSKMDAIKKLAFNNSIYTGKCIKLIVKGGTFNKIQVIDVKNSSNELILNDVQKKFINHFISRVRKGSRCRYLLNGEPGTGKTESIREITRQLMPDATFIIPEFEKVSDLENILESCEVFDNAVIIMDDIDLLLGSRDNGTYSNILGSFLSFFDGMKKSPISLLASTNDKGLVDKAAERPGRFNFTLDYGFLTQEQIIKVCNIHLPEKFQIKEVYDCLSEPINGKKVNITGAFIANLSENLREMSEDDEHWENKDTISLIKETYKGFYLTQVEKEKSTMGFQK